MAGPHTRRLSEALRHRSEELGAAFEATVDEQPFGASPRGQAEWAVLGLRLAGRGWKSVQLGARFFHAGKMLASATSPGAVERLADLLCAISGDSIDLALTCLEAVPSALTRLARSNHDHFLDLAFAVVERRRVDTWAFFDRAPGLMHALEEAGDEQLPGLVAQLIRGKADPLAHLESVSSSIARVVASRHLLLHDCAQRIAAADDDAAIAFLESADALFTTLPDDRVLLWVEDGLLLEARERADHFAIHSASARRRWTELSGYVEFDQEANLLQLFGQALGGEEVQVVPGEPGEYSGHPRLAGATDSSIDPEEYSGHPRLAGATDSSIDPESSEPGDARVIFVPRSVHHFDQRQDNMDVYRACIAHQAVRYQFGAVDPAELAFSSDAVGSMLVRIVEDYRIDAVVQSEYPGLSAAAARAKLFEVSRRRVPEGLPLRDAFIENLAHASLDSLATTHWPEALIDVLATSVAVLRMASRNATDPRISQPIAHWLFDLCERIPNLPAKLCPDPWCSLEEPIAAADHLPPQPTLPDDLPKLPDARASDPGPPPRTREMPDLLPTLTGETGANENREMEGSGSSDADQELVASEPRWSAEEPEPTDEEGVDWYVYDEWNYLANGHLRAWTRVGERTAPSGGADVYHATLSRHIGLVTDIRRQFEILRPEENRKIHKLYDGDEIDLEDAVRFVTEKKAGAGPVPRIYARSEKVERSVAVAFLLDISGSTSDPVDAGRRIIDVERDATVLIIEALQAIGDTYGVFGFSGYGRQNVAFHVIKDFAEPLNATVRSRVAGMEPLRSTRMGAAIRHVHARLSAVEARRRLLILVSDGRPQDQGYGPGSDPLDYAVHDTHRALIDARHAGITPFILTIDVSGQDYLQELCRDLPYEILANIEALPRRLPSVYRHLTR